MWFTVVCTLINNEMRHHSVKMLWTCEVQPMSTSKKMFFSERDQDRDTKKGEAQLQHPLRCSSL